MPLNGYFSATKLKWLIDNVPSVKQAHEESRLAFGTVDSLILHHFTSSHATDVTNASRTLLMDIHSCSWDEELCGFFGISLDCLPEIRSSSDDFGTVLHGPLKGIPICGVVGDQQAALVGHKCLLPGSVKNTYGTGCFMLFNTGTRPVESKSGLLTTVAYRIKDQETVYALEGSVAIAGAGIKWLRDNLGIIKTSEEISLFLL